MKDISIGIINLQHSKNYGALVQAYALQEVLNDNGLKNKTIDFRPRKSRVIFKVKETAKKILNKEDVFDDFRNRNINLTPILTNSEDLDFSDFSVFITGSDQVWRPRYTNPNAEVYFLNFGNSDVKKISYAASFGVDHWEEEFVGHKETDRIKELVNDFDHISVREASGVSICQEQFGSEAVHVLDPTLLAGRQVFERLLVENRDKSRSSGGLVYYKLDHDQCFIDEIERISDKYKIEKNNIYRPGKYIPVCAWLESIKNADLVITDSFHGVCFCLIFNKNFICVVNKDRGRSRLESLLSLVGLKERLVDRLDSSIDETINKSIDYNKVNNLIEQLRQYSLDWLIKSVNG
ncbi:polysaccharide pyruvyl transferase family protein [Vibrio sp. RE86]|uniref:polysaccharide pyruvyl transferase family protein n=1 Tax=Vibrio sp. RE86 TaxID=2607605 RepID=UPI001493525F|nr:polysaccharide pyruvyl transferase family protein [Vibrio sp. RE86]NOH79908.1 polysaccharide pyruvyl transferase family protein [Vibrio sp. RE86]